MSRDLTTTINTLVGLIPTNPTVLQMTVFSQFRNSLGTILTENTYGAPENVELINSLWDKLARAVKNIATPPVQDWQYQILSAYTTTDVSDLQAAILLISQIENPT